MARKRKGLSKRWWILAIVIGAIALSKTVHLPGESDDLTTRSAPAAQRTPAPVANASPKIVAKPAVTEATTPQFNQHRYVAGDNVRLRRDPSSTAPVLASLDFNSEVDAADQRGSWTRVRLRDGTMGWIGSSYLQLMPATPRLYTPPSVVRPAPAAAATTASCPSRRYCRQIGSCTEARFYLANCSWGGALDSDHDGVPCETICR